MEPKLAYWDLLACRLRGLSRGQPSYRVCHIVFYLLLFQIFLATQEPLLLQVSGAKHTYTHMNISVYFLAYRFSSAGRH
jgi:hypothetical protein